MDSLTVNIIDMSMPSKSDINIAVINQPNPVTGYAASPDQLLDLFAISKYKITETATGKPVTGDNFYDYFPELDPSHGGGGGGSTNYNDLTDKPSINSVTIQGNVVDADLGIQNCKYDPSTDELYTNVDGTRVVLASDIKAQPLIPKMTSATTPSGTIENGGYYGYGDYGTQNNWNAFDQNTATYLTYNQENVTDGWLSYEFDSGNSYYVTKIVGKFGNYQASNSISATLYVYDDDGVEHLVGTQIIAGYSPGSSSGAYKDWEFIVNQNVRKLKFVFGYKSSGTNVYTYDIQAYGYTM